MIKTFVEPPLDNNNYVVIDEPTGDTVLIDCSAPDDSIMDFIRAQNATLRLILLTHAHLDHVMGITHFQKKHNIPVYVPQKDDVLLSEINQWTQHLGWPTVDIPHATGVLETILPLTLGSREIKVIPTPGHTEGGVCYLIGKDLFSGDTLFRGTHGRTDLPHSNPADMQLSLKHLFSLPDDVVVYPGHGSPTTIGDEKKLYSP